MTPIFIIASKLEPDKVWSIQTMEYYSAIKRNGLIMERHGRTLTVCWLVEEAWHSEKVKQKTLKMSVTVAVLAECGRVMEGSGVLVESNCSVW